MVLKENSFKTTPLTSQIINFSHHELKILSFKGTLCKKKNMRSSSRVMERDITQEAFHYKVFVQIE